MNRLSRRRFLGVGAALLAQAVLPATGRCFESSSRFTWAQLRYGGTWDPNPKAGARLLSILSRRTSVEAVSRVRPVDLSQPELFTLPFLYIAGRSALPRFSETETVHLQRYLENGGFILFDDASGVEDSTFYASAHDLIAGMFPGRRIGPLPADHTVFQSFYLLRDVPGRKVVKPFLYGMDIEDLTPVIFSQNDLGGAWDGDASGYTYACTPGGEHQREMTFRLGINLVMYALTGNYKKDQVHIPFILKRRQLKR